MPGKLSWLALGVGAYLAFALASIPAATAYRWLAPEELRLSAIQGTLWSGQAALGAVDAFPLHDIQWRLRPWTLFMAGLGGEVQTRLQDGFLTTEVSAGFRGTSFSNLRASTSLTSLTGILPLGGIQGSASANFTELRLRDGWPIDAVGQITLSELAVPPILPTRSNAVIPMGSYRITFGASGGQGLAGSFQDQGGPLEVNGSLRLGTDRGYVIEGVVRAKPEASVELVQGVEFMAGPADSSGMRPFNLTGSL